MPADTAKPDPIAFCSREGCELVDEPHLHVAGFPAGWGEVEVPGSLPVLVDPADD